MVEQKPVFERLGYVGGPDESLGSLCEAFIIRQFGRDHYVLYEMCTYRDERDLDSKMGVARIKVKHNKLEFRSLEQLMEELRKVRERLAIDTKLPWVETNATCGYNFSEEEFQEARRRHFGL